MLQSVLVAAKPEWSERDRLGALAKLNEAGIHNLEQLDEALRADDLNQRLRLKQLKEFKRETLQELRRHMQSQMVVSQRREREPNPEPPPRLAHADVLGANFTDQKAAALSADLSSSINEMNQALPERCYLATASLNPVQITSPESKSSGDPFAKDSIEHPVGEAVEFFGISKLSEVSKPAEPVKPAGPTAHCTDPIAALDEDGDAIPDYSELLRELDSANEGDNDEQRGQAEGIPINSIESQEALRELLECFEQIESAPRAELQKECGRMDLAACSTAPRQELRRILREGLIWQQLTLPALRTLCHERGFPSVEQQTRTSLLQRLSEQTWEDMGVPVKRFHQRWDAQKALDEVWRLRQEASKNPECLREHVAGVVSKHSLPAALPPRQLLQWLEKITVWQRLPVTELRRECQERGFGPGSLLSAAVAAGAELPSSNDEAGKLRAQLVLALRRERCEAGGIPMARVGGSLEAAESALAAWEQWQAMDTEALKAEAKTRNMPLPKLREGSEEGRELLLRHMKAALICKHMPLDMLRQECSKRNVAFREASYFAEGVPEELFITGSWHKFTPEKMRKRGSRFVQTFRVSASGGDRFQLMLEAGNSDSVLYPSVEDANPWVEHSILGPDDQGRHFDWRVGQHEEDAALSKCGAKCVVVVSFEADPPFVSWAEDPGLLATGAPIRQFSHAGPPRSAGGEPPGVREMQAAAAELAHKQALRGLLDYEVHAMELEAEGVPVRLFESTHDAHLLRAVRQECLEISAMSRADLLEWYDGMGFPKEQVLQREELASFCKRYVCWQAMPPDLLQQECNRLKVEVEPETAKHIILRQMMDQDRMEVWDQRGYEARRVGDVHTVISTVLEYEALLLKSDVDLRELCNTLELPPEEAAGPREKLLKNLKTLIVWAALSEPQLRELCKDKGLISEDVPETDLLKQLQVFTFRSTFEARGLPVSSLGHLKTYNIAVDLKSLEEFTDEELQQAYEGNKKLLPPGLGRQTWLAFVRDLTLWEALPLEGLWKECEARGLPMSGFELTGERQAQTDERLLHQLKDRLILREHIVEAYKCMACTDRHGARGVLDAGAYGLLPQDWPEVWMLIRQLRDPFVSQYLCNVAAKPLPTNIRLPPKARRWHPLEATLHALSRGTFDPSISGRSSLLEEEGEPLEDEAQPRVSVVCPTSSERRGYHPLLYECFRTQDYNNRELVVVDSGDGPSPFFTELTDPRVIYRFFDVDDLREGKLQQRVQWSLGLKRNVGCCLARGAAIAHFDDDDLYARGYLSWMVTQLQDAAGDRSLRKPAAAKLTEWHIWDCDARRWRFLDVAARGSVPTQQKREWLYGWGFSYVFTRSAWELSPFPDVEFAEDAGFVESLMARRVPVKLARLPRDRDGAPEGLVAHSFHSGSTSGGELDGGKRAGLDSSMPYSLAHLVKMVRENNIGGRAGRRQGWVVPGGKLQPSIRIRKPAQRADSHLQGALKPFGALR